MEQGQDNAAGRQVLSRLLRARDQARLQKGAAPSLPRPQPLTVNRAAMTAMARAFDQLYDVPATTLDLTPAAITLAEMAELLPQPALLSVVQGPDEVIGVVAICPTLMTALIELQTLGRITARPLDSRKPTRSDAIICADFVNRLLDELGHDITPLDGFEGFAGFRYASFLDDPRPLLLMLEDSPYRSLRFRLRVGQDPGREGEIFVALPQKRAVAALPPKPAEPTRAARPSAGAGPLPAEVSDAATLAAQMEQAPVDLYGVLCRRKLRLRDLRDLKPGQILPLPRLSLSETQLETGLGQVLAIGKLGEADGYCAIRLRAIGSEESASRGDAAAAPIMAPLQPGAGAAGRRMPDAGQTGLGGEPPIADLDQPDGFRKDLGHGAGLGAGDGAGGDMAAGAGSGDIASGRLPAQQKTAIRG